MSELYHDSPAMRGEEYRQRHRCPRCKVRFNDMFTWGHAVRYCYPCSLHGWLIFDDGTKRRGGWGDMDRRQ